MDDAVRSAAYGKVAKAVGLAIIIYIAGGQQVAVHRAGFQLAGACGEQSSLARRGCSSLHAQLHSSHTLVK